MDFSIFFYFAIVQVLLYVSAEKNTSNDYNLKSVHVLFRHGDRAPDALTESFPNDLYHNYSYHPYGHGELTNIGKRRLYNLGNLLRKRYDSHLGNYYRVSDLQAISTNVGRTKMSLQLVLAALYKPKGDQKWSEDLDWQPIPYDYLPLKEDYYFVTWKCQAFMKELNYVRTTNRYLQRVKKFESLMKNLTRLTGKTIKTTRDIYFLYHALMAQSHSNLTLPEWTESYFPDGELLNATLIEYDVMSFNDQLKRLNGGMALKKILDGVLTVVNKTKNQESAPKVYLFAAHETNIAAVLKTLNLWNNIVPHYTSAIIFELYEKNLDYFIKIVYYDGVPGEFKNKKLIDYDLYCPLENFLEITKEFIPIHPDEECNRSEEEIVTVNRNF